MKKALILVAMSSFALASCGTTYTPPTEPAPAIWQGKAGIKITGKEYKLSLGIKNEGDVFAEIDADHVRKGRLTEDVTFTSGPGVTQINSEMTLKAGTPLYARQFTQSITTFRNSRVVSQTQQRSDRNPIEWCAERPESKGAVCMFWQDPVTAFFAEDRRGSSVSPEMRTGVGAKGPMPKVVEDMNVKFNNDIKLALVVARSNKKKILIQQIAGSNVEGRFRGNVVNFQDKRWGEDGTTDLSMAGGKFKLSKVFEGDKETDKVKVEVLEPPKLTGLTALSNLSPEDRAKLMQLLLKAATPKDSK